MAYTPNYILPQVKDKSYVMLLIITAALKRSLHQFVIFNSFPEVEEDKLIDLGVKVIEGKLKPSTFISELEKICKELKGKEIEFSSDFKHRVTNILLQNTSSQNNLSVETQKQVNKDGTDKQTTYQPAFTESKSQIKETKDFVGGYYIEDPAEGVISNVDTEKPGIQPEFANVLGTESQKNEMYTGGLEDNGDALAENVDFTIDKRYQQLSNVNKQLVVSLFRAMGELLTKGITKEMMDDLVNYVSENYKKYSKHRQIEVNTLLHQLCPEKWEDQVKTPEYKDYMLNSADKSLKEDEDEEDSPPYFFYIEDMGKKCIIRIGYPMRGNGTETNYKERLVRGEEPYSLGTKTYQSYLSGTDILRWLRKDYESVTPIKSESEFDNYLPITPVEEAIKATNTKITAKMTPIKDSRIIKAAGYDNELETLYVRFRKATYEYYDVPEKIYQELLKAPSAGSYFIKNIQKTYNYNKVKVYKSKAGRPFKEGDETKWFGDIVGKMPGASQSEVVDTVYGSTFEGLKGEVNEYLQNHSKMTLGDFIFYNPEGQEVDWETGEPLTMEELQDFTPYFNKKVKVLISSEDLGYDLSNEVSGLNENTELEEYDELVRSGKVSLSKTSQTPISLSGWEMSGGEPDEIDNEIGNYYISDLQSGLKFTNWYKRNKNKNLYSVIAHFPDGTEFKRHPSRTETQGGEWEKGN